MKIFKSLALTVLIATGGCTSIASGISTLATELSSSTPTQVRTLADAERVATLVTKAATVAVNTGKLTRAQLTQLDKLNEGVHAALSDLHQTQKEGGSLAYGAFNAALAAFNAYTTQQGIAH